jgi:hypothetical protein
VTEKGPEPGSYGHELEMQRQRAQWDQERRERKAQQEREQKQARLQAYLKRRGEEWASTTGEKPSPDDLATWRREYMAEKENEYQREQQKKLQEAERLYGF